MSKQCPNGESFHSDQKICVEDPECFREKPHGKFNAIIICNDCAHNIILIKQYIWFQDCNIKNDANIDHNNDIQGFFLWNKTILTINVNYTELTTNIEIAKSFKCPQK